MQAEPTIMVPHNVAEIIRHHVTLEVEGIDRLYLNGYVPGLQTEGGFVHFVRRQLGYPIASTTLVAPLSNAFVRSIEGFAKAHQLDIVAFEKKQRLRGQAHFISLIHGSNSSNPELRGQADFISHDARVQHTPEVFHAIRHPRQSENFDNDRHDGIGHLHPIVSAEDDGRLNDWIGQRFLAQG